jgi:hypothetical protein
LKNGKKVLLLMDKKSMSLPKLTPLKFHGEMLVLTMFVKVPEPF